MTEKQTVIAGWASAFKEYHLADLAGKTLKMRIAQDVSELGEITTLVCGEDIDTGQMYLIASDVRFRNMDVPVQVIK